MEHFFAWLLKLNIILPGHYQKKKNPVEIMSVVLKLSLHTLMCNQMKYEKVCKTSI